VNEELMNLPRPVRAARVWVGEIEAAVEYCGQAPGMVFGLVQVNVRIPPDVPSGAVSIAVAAGDRRSAADLKIWVA
jgi:uncharacterized protein (TIGR03437 family)